MGLRKGQKELVELYRGGYCAVPAIPGGGKTHCLTLWAVETIIAGLHRPGKILIVTYMNSAVSNFKQRIAGELQKRGVSGSSDYFVSTIHGLCLQIIKEKPDRIYADEEFQIVDEVTKYEILRSCMLEWRKNSDDVFRFYLDESQLSAGRVEKTSAIWQDKLCNVILSAIGDFKSRGVNPAEAKARCSSLSDSSLLKCAAEIYGMYDKRLKMAGYLDFDDMLYNAKRLLMEDKELLNKYRKRYTFVCEDEAQDSNLIQNDILSMIANGNLLRVGDSNQAICGTFTNSDFKYFKNFCRLPQTTVYNITQSSRNTREIIDLANFFVRHLRDHHPVAECRNGLLPQYIEPVDDYDERKNPVTPEYGIRAAIFNCWEEEVKGVVRYAFHMLKKYSGKSIAILMPSAWKINDAVSLLEAENIPYEELSSNSSQKNRALKCLGRVLDYISCPHSGQKFANLVEECFLQGSQDAFNHTDNESSRQKIMGQKDILLGFLSEFPPERLLYPEKGKVDTSVLPEELLNSKLWDEFSGKLVFVRQLLEFPTAPVEKLILFIADLLCFGREEKAIAHKVASDAGFLIGQGMRRSLKDIAIELLDSRNRFSYFAGMVWELKGYEPKPGVVTITTYHKSKGLEWDVVFLTGLNNADFPVNISDKFIGEYWFLKQAYKNPQAIVRADMQKVMEGSFKGDSIMQSKLETISEKARLLYVGITRAKEYLFLSGFHSNAGKRNEIQPSKYLIDLKRYIDEREKELMNG